MSPHDTKDRILDAAERLLGEHGSQMSLRAVTQAAQVNLAAVNYHFGSKEGLLEQVIARRVDPVNAERLRMLDELESTAHEPALEQVLEAFFRPVFELHCDPAAGRFCAQLVGRIQADQDPAFRQIVTGRFERVFDRFTKAIHRTVAQLTFADLLWRLQFTIGAMAFTLGDTLKLAERTEGASDPRDVDAATQQMIRFTAAGFRAATVQPGEVRS